jgi:hypothetical protein
METRLIERLPKEATTAQDEALGQHKVGQTPNLTSSRGNGIVAANGGV